MGYDDQLVDIRLMRELIAPVKKITHARVAPERVLLIVAMGLGAQQIGLVVSCILSCFDVKVDKDRVLVVVIQEGFFLFLLFVF